MGRQIRAAPPDTHPPTSTHPHPRTRPPTHTPTHDVVDDLCWALVEHKLNGHKVQRPRRQPAVLDVGVQVADALPRAVCGGGWGWGGMLRGAGGGGTTRRGASQRLGAPTRAHPPPPPDCRSRSSATERKCGERSRPVTWACGHSSASQREDTPTLHPTSSTSRGCRAPCSAPNARSASRMPRRSRSCAWAGVRSSVFHTRSAMTWVAGSTSNAASQLRLPSE